MSTRPKRRPRDPSPRVPLPEARTLTMPPEGYQPSKADLEETSDMLGMTDEQLRATFVRPFRFVKQPK